MSNNKEGGDIGNTVATVGAVVGAFTVAAVAMGAAGAGSALAEGVEEAKEWVAYKAVGAKAPEMLEAVEAAALAVSNARASLVQEAINVVDGKRPDRAVRGYVMNSIAAEVAEEYYGKLKEGFQTMWKGAGHSPMAGNCFDEVLDRLPKSKFFSNGKELTGDEVQGKFSGVNFATEGDNPTAKRIRKEEGPTIRESCETVMKTSLGRALADDKLDRAHTSALLKSVGFTANASFPGADGAQHPSVGFKKDIVVNAFTPSLPGPE